MTTVLFFRDFRGFTGGHLKVWHYFNHVRQFEGYAARICFTESSAWDAFNPWTPIRNQTLSDWRTIQPDVLFLEGLDWHQLDELERGSNTPKINLIQGMRHADRSEERYSFLKYRAIRFCVSPEVQQALEDTQKVNGPLLCIPNGLDVDELPRRAEFEDCDVLIAALKMPHIGGELLERLSASEPGLRITLLTTLHPRADYLEKVARARIAILLPHLREGFYLPALEAMALGSIVVCPDCVGNRSFALPDYTCFRPDYNLDAIIAAAWRALHLSGEARQTMLFNAAAVADSYSLASERERFRAVLERISELW